MDLCSRCRNVLAEGHTRAVRKSRCRIFDGGACEPCRELQDLDTQISQVEAFLAHLRERRPSIKAKQNRAHDPLSRTFPPEVISRIFSFHVFSSGESVDLESYDSPLALGAVCLTWRKIAWETPGLWSSLTFKVDKPVAYVTFVSRMKLFEQGFARSGSLPLSFKLQSFTIHSPWDRENHESKLDHDDAWKTFASILNRYSERWRSFDIRISTWDLFYITPQLRRGFPNLLHLSLIPNKFDYRQKLQIFGSSSAIDIPAPSIVKLARLRFDDIKISWMVISPLSSTNNLKCWTAWT
ncbi:unnamed protein product [Cyclocybe aegerita]|uniref:F-box domain-containing protein n=1 Tax=Cyclocybe aegerita TaxID=1973307 RepID=A0A8S0WL99_CYCAE|nr:unnamed protein product [Cyclocybe aegerita]